MNHHLPLSLLFGVLFLLQGSNGSAAEPPKPNTTPLFTRHVQAVFSRLGCNGGTCHGAVKGQGGFRLSLFGADPDLDHERLLREVRGRRLNLIDPESSLLLLKATARVPHQGGKRMGAGSPEYEILRRWIAAGASRDNLDRSRVTRLSVLPGQQTLELGKQYRLRVQAEFSDGSSEDVTRLCVYQSLDPAVAVVTTDGQVTARGAGDAAINVRFRAEPALATLVVPRQGTEAFPAVVPHNFIDRHILAKLRRLNIPPADLADDATFLRRSTLDVTGELPAPAEVRAFLADESRDKRDRLIDRLLARPGYAALWTLKFCDLLKASDFGVYADGIRQEVDAPRFQEWVRARLEENLPYDQFVERILTATSRDGRDPGDWAKEVVKMEEGYGHRRKDLELYRQRKTLDLFWQRSSSTGVSAALQVAHAFLGLRLECAQCHRHPHDAWQQDDLLAFANFFMRVRKVGFQGDNEKKFPRTAAIFKELNNEAKALADQVKKLRNAEYNKLSNDARTAKNEANRLGNELIRLQKEAEQLAASQNPAMREKAKQVGDKITQQQKELARRQEIITRFEKAQQQLTATERRSRLLPEAARRILHAEVQLLEPGRSFATVTSPLGTQSSKRYRLPGETQDIDVPAKTDPRHLVMAWMRRADNPWFARAIVNRVWAHYFGRGLVDPPDNLSSFNPPSHPELLQELCDGFITSRYDLKWLHRTILRSRTYQQSSKANKANSIDQHNHARFYYRRLPAEVLVDAINQATGTSEKFGMEYHFWPSEMKTVEIPFMPRNPFVTFMLANFGKPKRNSAVQCDCERDGNASLLVVLSIANHPRILAKIADEKGQAARIVKEIGDTKKRIDEVFLVVLSRLPTTQERQACEKHLAGAPSAVKGLQEIMWVLLNTREFLLQH